MKRVLICDTAITDCKKILSLLETRYSVKLITSYSELEPALRFFSPDIILSGTNFDGKVFSDLSSQINRFTSSKTILILKENENDIGLFSILKANDFVSVPLRMSELILRIDMHTSVSDTAVAQIFVNGDLKIDFETSRVYFNNIQIHLSLFEYKYICLLAKNCGYVVKYKDIVTELWAKNTEKEMRSVRVLANSVRKKLRVFGAENDYLQTHVGIGYCMCKHNDSYNQQL